MAPQQELLGWRPWLLLARCPSVPAPCALPVAGRRIVAASHPAGGQQLLYEYAADCTKTPRHGESQDLRMRIGVISRGAAPTQCRTTGCKFAVMLAKICMPCLFVRYDLIHIGCPYEQNSARSVAPRPRRRLVRTRHAPHRVSISRRRPTCRPWRWPWQCRCRRCSAAPLPVLPASTFPSLLAHHYGVEMGELFQIQHVIPVTVWIHVFEYSIVVSDPRGTVICIPVSHAGSHGSGGGDCAGLGAGQRGRCCRSVWHSEEGMHWGKPTLVDSCTTAVCDTSYN
jgi:hypothetical protein